MLTRQNKSKRQVSAMYGFGAGLVTATVNFLSAVVGCRETCIRTHPKKKPQLRLAMYKGPNSFYHVHV